MAIEVIVSRAHSCKATATRFSCPSIDSTIAANLAVSEIAAQTLETQSLTQLKIAEIGHPWEPESSPSTSCWRSLCVVWDTILGFGTTPSLKGDVSIWADLIMSFYFSKRTFENVAQIIKR